MKSSDKDHIDIVLAKISMHQFQERIGSFETWKDSIRYQHRKTPAEIDNYEKGSQCLSNGKSHRCDAWYLLCLRHKQQIRFNPREGTMDGGNAYSSFFTELKKIC